MKRILPLIFLVLLFTAAVREVMDPDFWWHLRTGQYIAETHTIPHLEIFSGTSVGKPWIAHEWLTELAMYAVYKVGGFAGLIVISSAVVTAAFVITYLRCLGEPVTAAVSVMFAAFAASLSWGARPQMVTILIASAFLLILEKFVCSRTKFVWLLVPLTLVWVNLHGGFPLGIFLIIFFMFGIAVDAGAERHWTEGTKRSLLTLGGVLAATIVVVPLNPNGAKIFKYPLETLRSDSMRTYISEWHSPDFHNTGFLPFAFLLLLTITVLAVSERRVRLSKLLLVLASLYASLQSARHIPIFSIVVAPVLAGHLSEIPLWSRMVDRFTSERCGVKATGITLLVFVCAIGAWRVSNVIQNQPSWERTEFPAGAVEFLRTHKMPAPIYNPYEWGGYLIWNLYPEYRVYIDGRADVHGDEFVAEYFQAVRGRITPLAQLERHNIRTVIVDAHSPMASLLRQSSQWVVAFEDSQAIVITRRSSGTGTLVGPAGFEPATNGL